MFNKNTLLKGVLLTAAVTFSHIACAAPMKLDEGMSNLNFFSVKNGIIGEVHTIPKLAGTLSEAGELEISLFLTSVETNVEIRNTRMNRHVFKTETNPIAKITANVAGKIPTAAGVSMIETEGELTMSGKTKKITVKAIVSHTGSELVVNSVSPIIVNAAEFGMDEGVKELQKLAALTSIATAVPVNFTLVFK